MKKVFNIIIVLGILIGLIATQEMYIDLFEWFFILLSCLVLTVMLGLTIAKNKIKISLGLLTIATFVFYILLTLFDIVGDYTIFHLTTTGPYDGSPPALGHILSETYDDFMFLNLLAPILIGLVGTFLTETKMHKTS